MARTPSTQSSIVDRGIRAARLEDAVYEEVEHDREATSQAAVVVVAGAVAAGIGSIDALGVSGIIFGTLFGLLGWTIYAWLAYFVGTRIFADTATSADWGELARALGFAQAPRVLLVAGIIPVLGALVGLAVFFWVLATTVVAIRAALDFSTGRAIATAIVAWVPMVLLYGVAFAALA
jgi:hypothetical protein